MAGTPEENKWAIDNGFTGWDDYKDYERQKNNGGGGGSISTAVAPSVKMKQEDIDLLKSLDPSLISEESFRQAAIDELTPYYERLLAESNWNVEEAKKRIEEDYKTGVRQQAEDAVTATKKLLQSDIPQENKAQLESLNQRGLLGTLLNQNAKPRTAEITGAIDTGTATTTDKPGEAVTATYTPNVKQQGFGSVTQAPVTSAQFGGLAGKQIAETGVTQDARQEAITRAFQRYNEGQNLQRTRDITDTATKGGRERRDLIQQRNERIPVLTGEKYARAINKNTLKRNTILEPYQLEAQGITGMLKY